MESIFESRIYTCVSTWEFRRLELALSYTLIIQYFAFLYRANSLPTEYLGMQTGCAKTQRASSMIRQHLIRADYNLPVLPFHFPPASYFPSSTLIRYKYGSAQRCWTTWLANSSNQQKPHYCFRISCLLGFNQLIFPQ